MAKRKLVDIPPAYHDEFEQIRRDCKRRKLPAPSIPYLVSLAIQFGLEQVKGQFRPSKSGK